MALDVEFLRELCLCPAPSGFEGTVRAVLRRRLEGVAETHADPLGNLWADAGPAGGPHLVAVAHADQIGMIVTHVDEAGYLRLEAVGLLDHQLLPGHTVLVHGLDGPVRGVVGRPPTHIVPDADRGRARPLKEQFVDIGARDRAEALERVAVGDPATFDQGFHELAPGRFTSLALDDRAGIYAVTRALERYAAAPGAAHLTAIASAHEETTFMGAKALGRRLRADCVVVVDTAFTSDYPGVDAARLAGEVKLGNGPMLGLGSTTNRALTALALQVAAELGIAVQTKAYAGEITTDMTELAAVGEAAALMLSIPTRYVHSAAEVADASDIEAAADLIVALAGRFGDVYTPGMFAD